MHRVLQSADDWPGAVQAEVPGQGEAAGAAAPPAHRQAGHHVRAQQPLLLHQELQE